MVFSVRSDPMLFKESQFVDKDYTRVKGGSNTSTMTLQVVGGDKKGSLKSETVKYPRDSNLSKTTLARASSLYKRNTRPLVREGAPDKQD
jgi:hypothetical protein